MHRETCTFPNENSCSVAYYAPWSQVKLSGTLDANPILHANTPSSRAYEPPKQLKPTPNYPCDHTSNVSQQRARTDPARSSCVTPRRPSTDTYRCLRSCQAGSDDVAIGTGVLLITSTNRLEIRSVLVMPILHAPPSETTPGSVESILLLGVAIGTGCIIAPGSRITTDCLPATVYAGNPVWAIRAMTKAGLPQHAARSLHVPPLSPTPMV